MFENILAGVLGNAVWFVFLPILMALAAWSWKLKKLSGFVSRMMRSGVTDFFPDRDSYTRDRKGNLEQYLQTAKTDLTYIGHWMAVTIDQRHTLDTIKSMLQNGKQISLILLNNNLPSDTLASYARFFGKTDTEFQSQIESGWNVIRKWRQTLGADEAKLLTIKFHVEFICHSAFVFDRGQESGKILIDQKIWGLDRKNSFGFEVSSARGDKSGERTLFERYSKSLKGLADHATVVI
ncbi:hypothetical protein ACT2FY_18205 [Paraburkholderia fungorum]|uniref:hypothetical protein n=1 Tax=Paraburkholderia fungorum TaxID=134537 RepID=UPI00402B3D5C